MHNIMNAILNCILISVPEETIWVLLSLITLKRFDLLDKYRWKENIKWILFPAIITSISISIFIYIYPSFLLKFFVSCIVLYLSLSYIIKKTDVSNENIKWYKIIISLVFGMIAITFTEMVYAPIVLGLSHQTLDIVNSNMWLKFLMTIPVKTFQILLVYFAYIKTVNIENKMDYILKDKVLSIVTVIFVSIILFVLASLVKWMSSSELFYTFSILIQVIISVLSTTIPTVLIILYIIPINYLLSKLFGIQRSYQQFLDETDV